MSESIMIKVNKIMKICLRMDMWLFIILSALTTVCLAIKLHIKLKNMIKIPHILTNIWSMNSTKLEDNSKNEINQ